MTRKVLIGMIAVCMFTDCTGLKEITAPEQEQGDDFWKGPGISTGNDSSESVCYVTGIDYPKMCFAFCQAVASAEGFTERYYIARDGRINLVEFEEDICCVLNPGNGNLKGKIFKSGKSWDMPEGYHFWGNNPFAVLDGDLHIGLTSIKGEKPLVWQNGKSTVLKLNGPICNLSISHKP